jgi:flagellar motility protein MotE (MotC chaperone)
MSQLSGILKGIFGVALIFFILWGLNQFGIIDAKGLILQGASFYPGLQDLPKNYELGKKRGEMLSQREKDLENRERKLKAAQDQLAADRDQFENDKNKWQNEHPVTAGTKYTPTPNYVNPPMPGKFPPPTSDQKLKDYLTRVGTMKPKQAALVIQKLPEETVFTIFDQLRPFQVSRIMENLPEDYLAKLTQDRLNKYRNL